MDIVERMAASSIRNPITLHVLTDRVEASHLMDEAATEITRLREENKRMRDALEPMVAAAAELAPYHYDEDPIDECYDACGKITCGDLRKAALATTGSKGGCACSSGLCSNRCAGAH